MGVEAVSVTGHHLDQEQDRQPTRRHRQDEGAHRGDPTPTGQTDQRKSEHARDTDHQCHDDIGTDVGINHELGDYGGDLAGHAAEE